MNRITSLQSIADDRAGGAAAPTVEAGVFVYEDMLSARSRDRKIPKKERTRALIMASAAAQLRENPLSPMTVDNLLDAAGLSRGTFYVYFNDISDLVLSLLQEFFGVFWANRPKGLGGLEPSDAMYQVNLFYCRSYEANVGLFSAFSRYSESNVEIAQIRGKLNSDWTERVVASIVRRQGTAADHAQRVRLAGIVRILIAMTVESLRDRYVYHDEALTKSFANSSDMAKAITLIWLRSIYGVETAERGPGMGTPNRP